MGASNVVSHRSVFIRGFYINFESETPEHRIRLAYGEEIFARLQTVKDKYDPDNFFRLNQNIPPSQVETARSAER